MVAPSADFKKIKARVGKRAPAKANVTDTSFQSAALHVAPQSRVAAAASSDDASAAGGGHQSSLTQRGLSLAQLQQQLRHPATPVRLSAVRGLQNLLVRMAPQQQQQQQQDSELPAQQKDEASWSSQQQLPLLLTALAPVVWLDDDPDVRRAGRAALQTLLSLSSSSQFIRPQAAYVTALVTTALHSLDGPQSLEAAGTVEWLAESAALDQGEQGEHGWLNAAVSQWVPPLTRLLSADQSNHGSASSAAVPTGSMRKKAKSHNKKRKRSTPQQQKNAATATAPKQCALRAIHALLRHSSTASSTAATSLEGGSSSSQPAANLTGSSSSVILSRRQRRSSQHQHHHSATSIMTSLQDFPSRSQLGLTAYEDEDDSAGITQAFRSHGAAAAASFSFTITPDDILAPTDSLNLLGQLRDGLVEATQNQQRDAFFTGAVTARLFLQSPHGQCLRQEMRRLLLLASSDNNKDGGGTKSTTRKSSSGVGGVQRLRKLCSQIAACVLEWFPLQCSCSSSNSTEQVEEDNAELCQTLMRLAATVQSVAGAVPPVTTMQNNSNHNKKNSAHQSWISAVASHVQSCLEQDEEAAAAAADVSSTDDQPPQAVELRTSRPLLGVLEAILLPREDRCGQDSQLSSSLVELFAAVFFSLETPLTVSKARSAAGRSAAMLACRWLLCEEGAQISRSGGSRTVATDLLYGIPHYLVQWRADYLQETATCVALLQDVVRRYHCSSTLTTLDGAGNDTAARLGGAERSNSLLVVGLVHHLRSALEPLLTVTTTSTENVSYDTETIFLEQSAIFELYPDELQRRVVCFLTMLSAPTSTTVGALGEICAKCHLKNLLGTTTTSVSPTLASFIVQCIHSIRRTIPMQDYLGFLIDSTGLLKPDGVAAVVVEAATDMVEDTDTGVRNIVSCLVDCGTAKVLPMLETLLFVLLKKATNVETESGTVGHCELVQARAALSMLAMFSLDLSRGGSNEKTSVFRYLSEGLHKIVTNCMSKVLRHCSLKMGSVESLAIARSSWVCPIVALLASEKGLLCHVFEALPPQLDDLDKPAQTQLLELWLLMIQNPQLFPALKRDAADLIIVAKRMDATYKSGPLAPLTGRIVAEMQLVSGEQIQ